MKVKLLICLTIVLLSLSALRVEAANYSFLPQNYTLGQWGQGNNYIVWIEEQIEAILDQFEEAGVHFPPELKENLKTFFADLIDSLRDRGMVMPYLGKTLFNIDPYNITFNYDLTNNMIDFKANNVITDDNNTVLVDLDGDLAATGEWDLHFIIQDTYYQNINKYLRQQNSGQAATFSQGKTSRFTQSLREFSLEAELCQDGVTFLYLNPRQINSFTIRGITYTNTSGFEMIQDNLLKEGRVYVDIIQSNASGQERQIYAWEKPLIFEEEEQSE